MGNPRENYCFKGFRVIVNIKKSVESYNKLVRTFGGRGSISS